MAEKTCLVMEARMSFETPMAHLGHFQKRFLAPPGTFPTLGRSTGPGSGASMVSAVVICGHIAVLLEAHRGPMVGAQLASEDPISRTEYRRGSMRTGSRLAFCRTCKVLASREVLAVSVIVATHSRARDLGEGGIFTAAGA